MDMGQIRERVSAKIAHIQEQIDARDAEILVLQTANTSDKEQIDQLRETEETVQKALNALENLDPVLLAPPEPPRVEKKRGPRVRSLLIQMLTDAGLPGISTDEAVAEAERRTGATINPASLRATLYKLKTEGVIEQRAGDKHWRIPPNAPSPADVVRQNGGDARV